MSEIPTLIAVVDDEEPIRKALQRLLRSAGLGVETYASGADFLRSLRDHRPDCVVLDLQMPGLSGFEVQEQLALAREPVPVVVITGNDTDEARDRSLQGGAAAYLRKPIDDRLLLDAIVEAVIHNERLRPPAAPPANP